MAVEDTQFQHPEAVSKFISLYRTSINFLFSSLSTVIQDESFSLDFGLAVSGVVGYANSGPHSNGSQFFITLGPCEWMNQKFVGFGRVIQGFSALRLLSSVKTSNQVPDKNIFISACGIAPVEEN